ncbi:MAG: bifunctional DNA-formamidopyrimidine glycosylase/DNA-(apurinic or apyrimidinic site) lyase [Chloroflexi bacterium]|nr:bifunctional DNA-formamidopyrimidine glycosylase/DNA-(apurinic or apyrimidinic site) lyase [Chloroflexota bacterium]MDA1146645.1 bifunctional DNA-formamidopyrimidine glycosylase/DNA-(apurinic or apyrimidinic site) lyase [Chloroflexota bacterium]MQC82813.1 bifunctional DNA-formamidopyrimidine glycosylase/DNA-(apurinic or apyrimidinic site) lyase [Chloroflexota bacterium]PKB56589.1 MAG: DNA-formamidopyrimidine glycosylase [SAR202 cluster bacterium Casp-Chloro-G1]
MPELPEVETTRKQLAPAILGRRIASVAIHPGAERLAITHAPRDLETALTGRTIEALDRHGKYLLARLDDGRTWVLHLRMSGSLVVAASDAPHRYERGRVTFEDGTVLRFNDLRKFGTWHLVEDQRDAMPNVGPDALSPEFTAPWLRKQLARRSVAVKSALLDQKVAAGVGNIYADEACYIAGIDPRAPANSLGPRRVTRLHAAVIEALERSLADGGTSFSDYLDGLGGEGLHRVRVHVFRREGEPCDRCRSIIRKLRLGGRGTHYCPGCQRL